MLEWEAKWILPHIGLELRERWSKTIKIWTVWSGDSDSFLVDLPESSDDLFVGLFEGTFEGFVELDGLLAQMDLLLYLCLQSWLGWLFRRDPALLVMALDRFENSLLVILRYFFLKINNLSLHLPYFLFEQFHIIKQVLFMRQWLILGTEEFFLEGSWQTTIHNCKNDGNT